MAKTRRTSTAILDEIRQGIINPLYFLMGDESYYIDLISNALLEALLDETQKDFDLSVVYGKDVSIKEVIMLARQYPMLAPKKVVIVREGQDIDDYELLLNYAKQPNLKTVLIINYKNGTPDKRKKYWAEIDALHPFFESKKLYDNEVPGWIEGFVKAKGFEIDLKSCSMLADYIGSDLSRISGEIEKLLITLPEGQSKITPDHIEYNIGISKEYNDFELINAISKKDALKANRIAIQFSKNPKNYPVVKTIATLGYFFTNLMMYHYIADKKQTNVMAELGIPFGIVKEYELASRNFSGYKTMQIIRLLREFDAYSKGIGLKSTVEGDLLKELLFRILH
jgi:DNA polymerase III subunit delta